MTSGTNSVNGTARNTALWSHPSPKSTQLYDFIQRVNQRDEKNIETYDERYQWSIQNVEQVWGEIPSKPLVTDDETMFPRPAWFEGAEWNLAENLLSPTQQVEDNAPAVIAATETTRERVSWRELRERVRECQAGMSAMKLKAGDRGAGSVANHTNALVAMLAATSPGAIWTAISPDTGVTAVLDRMMQSEPRLLFTDDAVMGNGKTHAVLPQVTEMIASSPTRRGTIIFETVATMETLKAIYSTGSPLAPSTFQYVYKAFGDINLGSITGGTDITSLFGAPCPLHPVYVGEIQVLGLGMAVQAWDYTGKDVSSTGEAGDLVCVKPFPCQPVQFWSAKGKEEGDEKYKASYFEHVEGRWHHGDHVRFNPDTGGLIMLGRSDGILKPSGVRFGSAEIYNILLKHLPDQVEDALCVGRRWEKDSDETVVLFLRMKDGVKFNDELVQSIKGVVRKDLRARHVPGIIDECPEIPVTTNGKKVEGAVKQILCGLNVKTSASVANAGCLDWCRQWAVQRSD